MLWCEKCLVAWEADRLGPAGECPDCGQVTGGGGRPPVPWHFKPVLVAAVVYLGWRAWQGVVWLIQHV